MPIERVIARQKPYFKDNIKFYSKLPTTREFAVFVANFRPVTYGREGAS